MTCQFKPQILWTRCWKAAVRMSMKCLMRGNFPFFWKKSCIKQYKSMIVHHCCLLQCLAPPSFARPFRRPRSKPANWLDAIASTVILKGLNSTVNEITSKFYKQKVEFWLKKKCHLRPHTQKHRIGLDEKKVASPDQVTCCSPPRPSQAVANPTGWSSGVVRRLLHGRQVISSALPAGFLLLGKSWNTKETVFTLIRASVWRIKLQSSLGSWGPLQIRRCCKCMDWSESKGVG